MPVTLQGSVSSTGDPIFDRLNFDEQYRGVYPNGLDLSPGSRMHQYIRDQIIQRANDSSRAMQARHGLNQEIDHTLTSYMPLSVKEKKMQRIDKRKPVPIVVPITYSVLETYLTYMVVAFLQEPMLQYEGSGPEDIMGAILLERLIQIQNHKAKNAAALHTQWRDAFAYGFGAVHLPFRRKLGLRTLRSDRIRFNETLQSEQVVGRRGERVENVMFEGTIIENIDPYRYLPDPSVPIHMVQEGEFVGWIEPTTRTSLLNKELSDDLMFNALYLHGVQDGRSTVVQGATGRHDKSGVTYRGTGTHLRPVDVIWMYMDIIPRAFGPDGEKLGDSWYPEKWLFALAADQIVIAATPLDNDHNMFPVAVTAPETDGYSVSPVASVEMTYGMQRFADFMFNSHSLNVRKALNDMFVVDPSVVNVKSLKEPGPGKIIYLNRSQWGLGKLDNAIKQFEVRDVTANHLRDLGVTKNLMEDLLGAQDILRGNQPAGRDRVTATEVRGAQSGSLKKMEKKARLIGIQSMQDVAVIMAYNAIQFVNEETYVKVVGRLEEQLKVELGMDGRPVDRDRVRVRPTDLDVNFDVVAHDGTFPGDATAESWIELYRVITQTEGLPARFDLTRIFIHIARLLGARNVLEFVNRGGANVKNISADPESVLRERERGNIIPTGGAEFNDTGQPTNGARRLAGAF